MYLIHQLLEQNAERFSERDAIVYQDQCISYQALADSAKRLAHALLAHGVKPGNRVAIYLDKGIEAVISLFGVLKAGATYVPLDPLAPPQRIAVILEDCGVTTIISPHARLAQLQPHLTQRCALKFHISSDNPTIPGDKLKEITWQDVMEEDSKDFIEIPMVESDLAYILYTSGSTGTPKGVMVSHRAALCFIQWACERFQLAPEDRVLNQAPLHFDLSIFDLFSTLMAGATLVLPPPGLSVIPHSLSTFLASQKISVYYSTPSSLIALILHGNLQGQEQYALRLILFAGEVFPPEHLRQLMQAIPEACYFNLYGPTETNVCAYFEVKDAPATGTQAIPIGKASANTELVVLNAHGVVDREGELYVRGPTLMSGYWGRPEQTKQCMIENSQQPYLYRDRLYRTGDQVRRLDDGNLMFLGRLDNMIKSRGYRIEPEEIERILVRHPDIDEAAVVPVPDLRIGNTLSAIVACHVHPAPTVRELKRLCAKHLPDYMVPQRIEVIESLPKTSTGKLDRARLRDQASKTQDPLNR